MVSYPWGGRGWGLGLQFSSYLSRNACTVIWRNLVQSLPATLWNVLYKISKKSFVPLLLALVYILLLTTPPPYWTNLASLQKIIPPFEFFHSLNKWTNLIHKKLLIWRHETLPIMNKILAQWVCWSKVQRILNNIFFQFNST